jgi:hypothetical protein
MKLVYLKKWAKEAEMDKMYFLIEKQIAETIQI